MTDPTVLVREEMERFLQALPSLLLELRGQWVVFKDGKVHSAHATEEEAYVAGRGVFGQRGGHVVAQVAEVYTIPLTAAVMFA